MNGAGLTDGVQEHRARSLNGLTVPRDSAMWLEITAHQRAGRLHVRVVDKWQARLTYIYPQSRAADAREPGGVRT